MRLSPIHGKVLIVFFTDPITAPLPTVAFKCADHNIVVIDHTWFNHCAIDKIHCGWWVHNCLSNPRIPQRIDVNGVAVRVLRPYLGAFYLSAIECGAVVGIHAEIIIGLKMVNAAHAWNEKSSIVQLFKDRDHDFS